MLKEKIVNLCYHERSGGVGSGEHVVAHDNCTIIPWNVDEDLMRLVNRRITISREEAMNEAHPEACWIAHLKETVKESNTTDFRRKVTAGIVQFKIVATHTPAEDIHPTPGENERRLLFQKKVAHLNTFSWLLVGELAVYKI